MPLDNWLKFGHILGAIVWLGGGLILSVLATRVRSDDDPAAVREFARTLGWVGPRVLTPAVLATVVFGIGLVATNAAWDFAQAWVVIGIAGFVAAFAIGVGYLSRIGIQLGRISEGTAPGPVGERDLIGRWIRGYAVVLAILVAVVWDMVFKPGL